MANVLSLAMKINADASGFKLDPVQRALVGLGTEADKVTAVFDRFKASSEAAGRVQEQFAQQAQGLINALRDGGSATQFAADFEKLAQAAREQAAAFEEGARVTESVRTAEERRAAQVERLDRLLAQSAITEETYNRAKAEASGANEAAAAAERELASQRQAAARIIEANLTGLERAQRTYDAALAETQRLEQAGLLTAAQANAERQRQAQVLQRVTTETERASAAARDQTLQFNELSGIFAALPGPLGNIAGRISGLSSAAEGLGRVFSGGLRQGVTSIGASLAGLVNPLTIATAGVAAFGAAARSIGIGLAQLEDRVENLGNTSDKLGISFEFVQVLDEAARRSGTSIDAVSAAFGRLQKSVLGVDEESKAAQAALAQIGVTAQQLQALKPEEQYQLIGQRIAAIEAPARRTATAVSLFGRSGADLLPFFRNIGGAADDLNRVGAALGENQRRDVDEFGGAMDRLAVATRGAGEQILASFAPAGEAIADSLAQAAGAIAQFVERQNDAASFSREFQELQQGLINRRANEAEVALLRSGKTAEDVLKRVEAQARILRDTGNFVELTDSLVDAALAGNQAAAGVEQVVNGVNEVAQLSARSQELAQNAARQIEGIGQAGLESLLSYRESLREIDGLVADKTLTEDQAAIASARVTAAYEQQIAALKRATAEKEKTATAAEQAAKRELDAVQSIIDKTLEQIRVERDFGGDANRARNAADLQRITDEIAKAEAAIAKANADSDRRQAAAMAARIAELDQVREALAATEAEFDQRADEVARGFSDGFAQAFEETTRGLDDLIGKAAEFGEEGRLAGDQLQQAIFRAQQQVAAGILTRPALQAEIDAQRRIAEERLAAIQREQQERQRQIDANFGQQVAANNRINAFLAEQFGQRERAELAALEARQQRQQEAARNVEEIDKQIAFRQEQLELVRQEGDRRRVIERQRELKALEDLRRAEQAIVDGKQNSNRQIARAANTAQQAQLAQQQIIGNTAERQIQATQKASSDAIGQVNQAFAQAADRQRKLVQDLNTLGSRTVNTADVRTAEGAALVLGLAANAQDPRLIEARLTNKRLREVAVGLTQNLNRIGIPAAILG